MTNTIKDRNYYRMMDDTDLIVEAKDNPTPELALVLAERLLEHDDSHKYIEHMGR